MGVRARVVTGGVLEVASGTECRLSSSTCAAGVVRTFWHRESKLVEHVGESKPVVFANPDSVLQVRSEFRW